MTVKNAYLYNLNKSNIKNLNISVQNFNKLYKNDKLLDMQYLNTISKNLTLNAFRLYTDLISKNTLFSKQSDSNDQSKEINTINSENCDLVLDDREENNSIIVNKITKYQQTINYLKENNIKISTITVNCKLNTDIMLDMFAKYVVLSENKIVSVKFGNRVDPATNRTIVAIKKKKKSSNKNFYNQVTILMKPSNNIKHGYINIKVFKNGSLHMTGVKNMIDYYDVVNTLIKILKKGATIKKKNKTKKIHYITNLKNVEVSNTQIRMINSNFRVDFKIDRKKLYHLLKKHHDIDTKDTLIGHVEASYNPNGGHSCVNIKHYIDEKHKPSIFVFQTGAIIITGVKSIDNIVASYKYIIKILGLYYNKIRIPDIDPILFKQLEAQYYKEKKAKQLLC